MIKSPWMCYVHSRPPPWSKSSAIHDTMALQAEPWIQRRVAARVQSSDGVSPYEAVFSLKCICDCVALNCSGPELFDKVLFIQCLDVFCDCSQRQYGCGNVGFSTQWEMNDGNYYHSSYNYTKVLLIRTLFYLLSPSVSSPVFSRFISIILPHPLFSSPSLFLLLLCSCDE